MVVNGAMHAVAGHAMPDGVEETAPEPVPAKRTWSITCVGPGSDRPWRDFAAATSAALNLPDAPTSNCPLPWATAAPDRSFAAAISTDVTPREESKSATRNPTDTLLLTAPFTPVTATVNKLASAIPVSVTTTSFPEKAVETIPTLVPTEFNAVAPPTEVIGRSYWKTMRCPVPSTLGSTDTLPVIGWLKSIGKSISPTIAWFFRNWAPTRDCA